MSFNEKVQQALRHINSIFPEVTQVFFSENGKWYFCGEDFEAPSFADSTKEVDISLLEEASDAADEQCGFPCAFRLYDLQNYYALWDSFGNVPVSDQGEIAEPFLHFEEGTQRMDIWKWFEYVHPDFIVGDVMAGIRRQVDVNT